MFNTQPALAALANRQFMALTTFRKNGNGVTTPVWFAQENDTLYVMTHATAGKLKRIRHNPRVQIAPCTYSGKVLGDFTDGVAHILPAPESRKADRALSRKYGLMKRIFEWTQRKQEHIYLEICPA